MDRSRFQATNTAAARIPPLFSETAPLVLIVDDDEWLRDLLSVVFQAEGYRVSRANDGAEALEKVRYLNPSVIVMDLCLPRYDGCAATKRLKIDARTSSIPIIALTGDEREDAPRRAWEAGCAAFFSKPADLNDLVQCAGGLIGAFNADRLRYDFRTRQRPAP